MDVKKHEEKRAERAARKREKESLALKLKFASSVGLIAECKRRGLIEYKPPLEDCTDAEIMAECKRRGFGNGEIA